MNYFLKFIYGFNKLTNIFLRIYMQIHLRGFKSNFWIINIIDNLISRVIIFTLKGKNIFSLSHSIFSLTSEYKLQCISINFDAQNEWKNELYAHSNVYRTSGHSWCGIWVMNIYSIKFDIHSIDLCNVNIL
jgi:hypothetical protein